MHMGLMWYCINEFSFTLQTTHEEKNKKKLIMLYARVNNQLRTVSVVIIGVNQINSM